MDRLIKKKILPLDELIDKVKQLKKKGKTIVQSHGVFDLVHLGHIRHFNLAKKEGDVLIVTVTKDKYVKRGPGRPIFNEYLRAETLASLAVIDFVHIVEEPTAVEFIKALKPDIYAKGPDYKEKDITGRVYKEKKTIESFGGRLVFTEDITFSSSKLINDNFDVYPQETVRYLKAISRKYPMETIIKKIDSLNEMKVLVLGDSIIDQYHYCHPMGKSSKEPLVVNKYVSEESFAGGVLATANNVANICRNVDMLTLLGQRDSFKDFIKSSLNSNIKPIFFYRKDAGSIVKRRFVNENANRKLFEICYMKDDYITASLESEIMDYLNKNIKDYDLVVISDFGHGLLTKNIIKLVSSKAKYIALNVQTNSANIGFNLVTKYPRANCVCIDEMELRLATHDKFGDLKTHAKKIYNQLRCENIIATRGAYGSIAYSKKDGFHQAPAFSYRVVDAIGAGDAFFAFVAPCFAKGLPQDLVSFIGNAVGSLAVQIVCNREPISYENMVKFIDRLLK